MKAFGLVAFAGLLSAVLVAADNSHLQPSKPADLPAAANPHWREDSCLACHKDQGPIQRIAPQEVDLLCLSCHNGVRARREPHPIGRTFAGNQVHRPDSWPTLNGQLSCLTCHDVLMHCKTQPRRPPTNPAMLRGPRLEGAAYCSQCHISELHEQHNPHVMVDSQGSRNSDSCLFCHRSEMQTDAAARRTGNASLKNEVVTLCGQCHKRHIDFFSPGHIGITATASVVAELKQTDIRLGFPHGANLNGSALPLTDGKVTCSTCHNPHQAGIFSTNTELGLGAMNWPRPLSPPPAQRLPGRELCSACHGF